MMVSQKCESRIFTLTTGDADGDGLNELAVTAADWRVRLFDEAGNERIVKDWRGVYEETGGKYYYGGQPHGVGFYTVAGQNFFSM
jgi:hypothetical protein